MAELSQRVQFARRALMSVLRSEERRTTRRVGSAHPITFEDHAARIARGSDRRAEVVGRALTHYQTLLNELWVHAIESGAIQRAADRWIRRREFDESRRDEALAEAVWLARDELARWRALATLDTYLTRALSRGLSKWERATRLEVHAPKNQTEEAIRREVSLGAEGAT